MDYFEFKAFVCSNYTFLIKMIVNADIYLVVDKNPQ